MQSNDLRITFVDDGTNYELLVVKEGYGRLSPVRIIINKITDTIQTVQSILISKDYFIFSPTNFVRYRLFDKENNSNRIIISARPSGKSGVNVDVIISKFNSVTMTDEVLHEYVINPIEYDMFEKMSVMIFSDKCQIDNHLITWKSILTNYKEYRNELLKRSMNVKEQFSLENELKKLMKE